MSMPPLPLVVLAVAMLGYPLIQILGHLASRPLMRGAVALGVAIKGSTIRTWEADAVGIALSGARGLPGYALLPAVLPWRLARHIGSGAPTVSLRGRSGVGKLRDTVIVVSLLRWPLTSLATVVTTLPVYLVLVLVDGPTAANRALVNEVIQLTGTLRLPRLAERAWIALAG